MYEVDEPPWPAVARCSEIASPRRERIATIDIRVTRANKRIAEARRACLNRAAFGIQHAEAGATRDPCSIDVDLRSPAAEEDDRRLPVCATKSGGAESKFCATAQAHRPQRNRHHVSARKR